MAAPWGKWFWSDWFADPGLRRSSYAARGLWMDMLCIAAEADPIGMLVVNGEALSVADIARMTGGAPDEVSTLINELDRNGVLSRDRNGTIYNRRMVREAKKAKIARINGKMGGNPTLTKQSIISSSDNPQDNAVVKGRDKPHIPEATTEREVNLSRSVDHLFEQFWQTYPSRGVAANPRKPALDRFRKVVKAGADPLEIIAGAKRYADERRAEDPRFTAQAVTWLNQERWKDGRPGELPLNGTSPHPTPPKDERDAEGRLRVGRERRMWPRPRWGPSPGEPGCTIPPHLIRPDDAGWAEWSADRVTP